MTRKRIPLPSSYLPAKTRSAVRYMAVGFTGSVVQTWFFMAALFLLGSPEKGMVLYYIAFAIGIILEMIPNFFFTNWYTFETSLSWRNLCVFLSGRVINTILQFGLLPLMIAWQPTWRDDIISLVVIFLAGCVNYLICLFLFKKE